MQALGISCMRVRGSVMSEGLPLFISPRLVAEYRGHDCRSYFVHGGGVGAPISLSGWLNVHRYLIQ